MDRSKYRVPTANWRIAFLAVMAALLSTAALAQEEEDEDEIKPPAQQQTAGKGTPQDEMVKWDKAIKDLPKTTGEFTLYTRKKDILVELEPDQIGKLFFVQATMNTGFGPLQAGDPLNEDFVDVFKFERWQDDELRLVKPNLNYRWDKDDPLALASERAFPEAILANFKIEATNPMNQHMLVNISKLFDGSVFKLQQAIDLAAGPGYMFDSQNSAPGKVKSFPENSVVQMDLHFRKSSDDGEVNPIVALLTGMTKSQLADGRSLPLKLTYNLWFRNTDGYMARLADPRVGYFTTDYYDVSRLKEIDRSVKLVQRWNLKKKNPAAALSEPVKPVVWYLDKSVPEEYKAGVRDGILFWNKAFEKIGFKDAMVVKDAPDDKDWDHADGRYNIIRWTMTDNNAYAVAWFRTDPLSGEIMNAAVTVDANYPASAFVEYREQVVGATARTPWFGESDPNQDALAKLRNTLKGLGWSRSGCDHAKEFQEHLADGWAVLQASGTSVSVDDYVRRMIADLVAHEVGHCLGLRHNFAASLLHSQSELADDKVLATTGVAASVMDYTPINLSAVLHGGTTYYNPTVGTYDLWAIQYGYGSVAGTTPFEERAGLNAIAAQSGQSGRLYLTDEDSDGVNPLAVSWDLGSDVLATLRDGLTAADRLREYAINKSVKNGEPYTRRNALVMRSIRLRFRDAQNAVRMVGGVEFRRHLKGDVGEKPTLMPTDPDRQEAAMQHLVTHCFIDPMASLPQDILFGMSQAPDAGGSDYIAPLRAYISSQQRMVLSQLLSTTKLDAIAENEFKTLSGRKRYTMTGHFEKIMAGVFTEVGRQSEVPALRRDLQRYCLAQLLRLITANAGSVNEDARLIAKSHLTNLKLQLIGATGDGKQLETMTRLHFEDMAEQIDRTLKRQAVINPY